MKNKFSKFINLQGKYLTSLLILLAMSIGNVWGTDVTFSAAEIAAGTAKGNIAVYGPTSTSNSKICTSSNVALVQVSNAADATYTDNAKRIAFAVQNNAGTITSITIHGSTNSSTADATANGPVIYWGDTSFPTTAIGYDDVMFKSYIQTNSCDGHYYTITPPTGTKAFAVYKRVKFNTTSLAVGGSEANYGGNTTLRIDEVTVTLTPSTPSCSTSITTQPSGATLAVGDANPTLSVVATNAASYAWKESSDGTSYNGASTLGTSASFTPSVNDAVQTKYYYCEVTSDCDGTTVVKSDIVTVNVVGAITYYTVTLVPAGGTIADATGWTADGDNYTKTVADGTELALPTFTKANRTFKQWVNAVPAAVASPITVSGNVTLTAVWNATIESVIYSWEGAEGGATEVGGTAAGNAENLINQTSAGYYCLKIDGNKGFTGNIVEITLSGEEKVKTGDKVVYWGFYNKSSSANARPKMRDGNSPNAIIFDDGTNLPNLYSGGDPAKREFVVPADINTNKVQIDRSQSGSNTWIPKLQIVREVQVEESSVLVVTFNSNGGSAVAEALLTSGQKVAKPADPTKEGYRFVKWQKNSVDYDFDAAVTASFTLDAVWQQVWTVTFNANGGSEVAAAVVDNGQTVAQPADPTRGKYTFLGWYVGDTDDAYDFTAAVTNTLTLKAHWQDPWTISFNDGEAAGASSLDVAYITVKHNTSAKTEKPADPTWEGYDFNGWFYGDPAVAFDWDANVTQDYALVASWIAPVAKYDVEYYDDEQLLLGVEPHVRVDQHPNPTAAHISTSRPLYSFDGWFTSSTLEGDPVDLNTITPYEGLKLYGKWTKLYATSIDFEAFIDANTTSGDWEAELAAKNHAIASTDNVTLDAPSGKPADKGLKIKKSGTYLSFNVHAGKLVILKTGVLSGAEISKEGGYNYTTLTSASGSTGASVTSYHYNAAEAEYKIRMKVDAYNIIQAITITDPFTVSFDVNGGDAIAAMYGTPSVILPTPTNGTMNFAGWYDDQDNFIGNAGASYTPTADIELVAHWEALSTVNTLSDLKVDDTTVDGFSEDVHTYYIVVPYGTAVADMPKITDATATNANATVAIWPTEGPAWTDDYGGCYRQQANVTPQDPNAEVGYNDIRITIAPKDGVSIIETKVTGQTSHGDVSGFIGGDAAVKVASNYKLNKGNYVGVTLAGSNKFQAGDVVVINVTNAENATGFTLYTTNDEDSVLIIDTRTGSLVATGINKIAIPATYADGVTPYEGTSSIYLLRQNNDFTGNMNARVDSIAVLRAMNPLLKTLSINGKDADVSTTAVSMELETGTNLGNLAIVETYISNDNSQVTTAVISNSGDWKEGENTYRVTDKDGDYTDYTITISMVTPAVAPTIDIDLASAGTFEEYSSATLSIAASTTDGGTLSYQWYKDDVAIDGAESASYEVSEEGTYKVVVKNSLSATNYATATSTACVMTEVMPSGCDELASIPSEEPYQYVQTDEWTLYSITSNGKLNTTNKFKNNAKNFEDADVNAISDQRFAVKFDKNVEHVDFYATASSTRTWNSSKTIQVTEDDIAGSTVTYTDVTAKFTTDLTTIVPTGTRQYIFRATGIFEAGKTYWFTFNGGLDMFRICYVEALEKPVLPDLSDEDICEGSSFTALSVASATVSEGTLSYQWYKDAEAIDGAEAATYQPTAAGIYYVIVTNSLSGRQSISAESKHAELTASTSAVINEGPANVRKDAGEAATLTVDASGKNLHYAWKESDAIDGTYTDVDGAADAASLDVIVPTGVKYYKVVVSSDCGEAVEAIAKVEEWVALDQVDVTATTEWDWVNAGGVKITPEKNVEILMANIKDGDNLMPNDANFNSQALLFSGQESCVNEGGRWFAKGTYIKFNAAAPGVVTVEFSDNGSNNRRLSINGKLSESSASKTDIKTFTTIVPAGEVTLMGTNEDGTSGYIRFHKITFVKVDYTRAVTAGRYGTICLSNGGQMYGGALYEVAYFDASKKKIFFDEVLNGAMVAGTPYIFLPSAGVDLLAVRYTDEANAPAGNMNGLYGSYTQELITANAGNYILLNNKYCFVDSEAYVGANRAYIKMADVPTNATAPAPGRRRIAMGIQGEEVATGIDALNVGETPMKVMIDGQMYILRGEKMYDATGKLVK